MRRTNLTSPGAGPLSLSVLLVAALLGIAGVSEASPPSLSGTFELTGSLNTARYQHQAVLLSDGQVLVIGGIGIQGNYISFASTELYSPSTGKWTVSGSMSVGRTGHSATVLKSGEVLVAGGTEYEVKCYATAELYNPPTGAWTLTGSMIQPRCLHSATLLPNGNVLVAGGAGSIYDATNDTVTTAEIYNPNTGTWTATGNLNFSRAQAATKLLDNGEVLTVGGYHSVGTNPRTYLTSAELYNPATREWSLTTGIPVSSFLSTTPVTLANGNVLISNAAQFYNPTTATWTATGALPTLTGPPQVAALLDTGDVLGTGTQCKGSKDYSCFGAPTAIAYLYNSSANSWSETGALHYGRFSHTMTPLLDGRVLVAGGYTRSGNCCTPLATSELYTP